MLVLSRKFNETLVIGDEDPISITVLGVRGNQVRLGIVAPPNISVHREEIFQRIKVRERSPGARATTHR